MNMETNNIEKKDDFEQKLVAKIKQENIAPKPRWHFLLKDYVIWAAGSLSLLIGAGAISVMIYFFKYNGWEIREETNKTFLEFFIMTLPYFWILFLALFIFVLYYNLQHTKRGYRYPVWMIISSSILASVILGNIFFLAGLGEEIDEVMGRQLPFYDQVINRHVDFWFAPEEGRLTGIVILKNEDGNFKIMDPRGSSWLIMIDKGSNQDSPAYLVKLNQPVDLIGKALDDNVFQAKIIRPVRPGRGFFSKPRPAADGRMCPMGECPPPSENQIFLPRR